MPTAKKKKPTPQIFDDEESAYFHSGGRLVSDGHVFFDPETGVYYQRNPYHEDGYWYDDPYYYNREKPSLPQDAITAQILQCKGVSSLLKRANNFLNSIEPHDVMYTPIGNIEGTVNTVYVVMIDGEERSLHNGKLDLLEDILNFHTKIDKIEEFTIRYPGYREHKVSSWEISHEIKAQLKKFIEVKQLELNEKMRELEFTIENVQKKKDASVESLKMGVIHQLNNLSYTNAKAVMSAVTEWLVGKTLDQ